MKTRKLILVLKDGFIKLGRKEKIVAILVAVFALLDLYLALGCLIGAVLRGIRSIYGESGSLLHYGVLTKPGSTLTLILFLVFVLFILLSGTSRDIKNAALVQDEKGMIIMEKSTFGDAHFMTEDETKQLFKVSSEEDTDTTIYGQLTANGEKVISFMPFSRGATGNFNEAVIGGSGSGKSSCYGIMKIVKAINRGESVIVTDPKGELYRFTSAYAKNNGYDVKILNLKYPQWTDYWDCLSEVLDPDTGRLDSNSLNDFVNIYMKNSTDGREQPYFYNNAASLLKAAIGYCAYMREDTILHGFRDLFESLTIDNPKMREKKSMFQGDVSFAVCEELLLTAAKETCVSEEDIVKAIKEIYSKAPMFTIAQVYFTICQFDEEIRLKSGDKETYFDSMPNDHPGKMAYNTFKKNTKDSVKGGAEQGVLQRFDLFTDKNLRTILSNEGIIIRNIRKRKTAIYVIVDDTVPTTKPIVSLFFSFLLKDCQKQWDEAENDFDADGEHKIKKLLPMTIILDELYSCGVIGSEEKTLPQTLSVARSKKINFGIILQGYDQLKDIYGESNRNNILGQCSTKIFLGLVDDQATTEWISFMTGDATVMSESHIEGMGLSSMMSRTDQVNQSAARRILLTPGQVAKWKNEVLMFKSGEVGRYRTFHWQDSMEFKSGMMPETSFTQEYKSYDQKQLDGVKLTDDPFRVEEFSTKHLVNEAYAVYDGINNRIKDLIETDTASQEVFILDDYDDSESDSSLEDTVELDLVDVEDIQDEEGGEAVKDAEEDNLSIMTELPVLQRHQGMNVKTGEVVEVSDNNVQSVQSVSDRPTEKKTAKNSKKPKSKPKEKKESKNLMLD